MLIKLTGVCKTETLDQAMVNAQGAGRKYINIASQLFSPELAMTGKARNDGAATWNPYSLSPCTPLLTTAPSLLD